MAQGLIIRTSEAGATWIAVMSGSEILVMSQLMSRYVCMQIVMCPMVHMTVWSHGPNSTVDAFPPFRFLIGRQSLALSGCSGGGGTAGAGGSAEELDAAGGCDAAAISLDAGLPLDCSA